MAVNQKNGKVVVVGDGACGKTCLLEVFKSERFPEEYVPTVVDNFSKTVKLDDNRTVNLALWDTAGQEDYDTIRPLSYQETDLVLLCYTIENRTNLENISHKWLVEIKNYCPNAKYFLIALKKDLRDEAEDSDERESLITQEEGEKWATDIKAERFIECSAMTRENVSKVFEDAAEYVYKNKQEPVEADGCCGGKFFCC